MNDITNYTFKEFVENAEALKTQYEECFTPFFNAKLVRCWKTMIYSLNIELWKRDRLWEYLNGDEIIQVLKMLIK